MTMTNATVPSYAALKSPEMEAFAGIEARAMDVPEVMDLKPSNPMNIFRFVNRTAGDGLRFNQMQNGGFVVAKESDVKDCPKNLLRNGQIIYGDLILMMTSKERYYGALKYNHNKAIQRGNRNQVLSQQQKQVQHDINAGGPPSQAGKLSTFIPGEAELKTHFGG